MKHEIDIFEEFGPRLSDGSQAYQFRLSTLDSYFSMCDSVVLDFSKVRIANSSFMNALLAHYFELNAEDAMRKLQFKGCRGVVKTMVHGAIDLGVSKYKSNHQSA